jgi:acetylglutamate kinase
MDKIDLAMQKADVLVDALPYIQDFRGSTVLVKVGGSVMEGEANVRSLLADIAFMNAVGMKVVLVHGGGKAISRALTESGIEPKFVKGLRVTDEPTMEIVRRTLNNGVNANIVKILREYQANARPLHGNWMFTAEKLVEKDPETGEVLDRGYVGTPVAVDTRAVSEMLDAGIVPVVTPLGTGRDGHLYNINADSAAAALAKALKVRKFAVISDVPGLLRDPSDPSTLLSTLRLSSVAKLKEEGVISGGMLPKIEGCEEVIRSGVRKVHLVDGRMPHSLLLEMFTREGVGTEIIADEQ